MINERLGVNDDVIILSDFIVRELYGKPDGTYVFNKKEIPETNLGIDINKMTIKYKRIEKKDYSNIMKKNKGVILGALDVSHSKRFKSGNVELVLVLSNLKKSVIYHEINHALQFVKLGKSNMIKKNISHTSMEMMKPNYEYTKKLGMLSHMVYRSIDLEVSSNVIGFYAQVKGLMKKRIEEYRKKGIDENKISQWKKEYFSKTLNRREIYAMSYAMEYFDIYKMFKDPTDEEKEYILYLYVVLNYPADRIPLKVVKKFYNEKLHKTLEASYKKHKIDPINISIDDENQMNNAMKYFQNTIRKSGKRMRKKLIKVWTLLEEL